MENTRVVDKWMLFYTDTEEINLQKIKTEEEYQLEIGTKGSVPVMLRKEDIRHIIRDALNSDSTFWCEDCRIKVKKGEFILTDADYEQEAETLASGGTLAFTLWEPFENINDNGIIKAMENYELTLKNVVKAIKTNLLLMNLTENVNYILRYSSEEDRYYLEADKMSENMKNEILQRALFDKVEFK